MSEKNKHIFIESNSRKTSIRNSGNITDVRSHSSANGIREERGLSYIATPITAFAFDHGHIS